MSWIKLNYPYCKKSDCITFEKNRCILKEPEKINDSCLYFEDNVCFQRLKNQAVIQCFSHVHTRNLL